MKRVASLYLPDWSIDRLRRAARTAASPDGVAASLEPLAAAAATERSAQCDAPRNSGWRPGARWARQEEKAQVQDDIARLHAHQRPPMRELGRRSEALGSPYRLMPGDEGGTPIALPGRPLMPLPVAGLVARPLVPSVQYPGEGPRPDTLARRGSNDPHASPPGVDAFFNTGRGMAGTVGRVCRDDAASPPATRTALDRIPLVTVHKVGSRGEIAAASPAARVLGIVPGMALTQARASVPELEVRDADPSGDAAALLRLATALARRWTPTVALSGDDGLLLDLSGVAHLHGGEAAMARRIIRLLARIGFAAHIAVADTAGAAWALSRHTQADVVLCPPGAHIDAIASLPVAALRVDLTAVELLQRLGVDHVGAIAELPRGPLVRRFGATTALRLDQATGAVAEPLVPVLPAEPITLTQRFAEPIATPEAIAHWLNMLTPRLAVALAEAGLGARALVLAAERIDARIQTFRIGLARASRDPAHLLRLLARRIEQIEPGYGIEALTLHVLRSEPLGAQSFTERLDEETKPDLAPLVDTLATRIGAARLWRSCPVESDVPERAVATTGPLDPPASAAQRLKTEDVRQLDQSIRPHPWHPRWPRPARLLRRPEPLDHVLAELPDQPPRRFTWRGEIYRVVRADGPERISGEWWRGAREHHAIRDYFQIEDEAGHRFWLFRRGDGIRTETGDLSWFMHGSFG